MLKTDSPILMTVKEVAHLFRLDEKTVYRKIQSGEIPARRIRHTNQLRVPSGELESVLRPVNGNGARFEKAEREARREEKRLEKLAKRNSPKQLRRKRGRS